MFSELPLAAVLDVLDLLKEVQDFFQLSKEPRNCSWAGAFNGLSNSSWVCPLGEVFEST